MIFVLDVGNTNIVMGVYAEGRLLGSWRMTTDREKTSDEFGMFFMSIFSHEGLSHKNVRGVIMASVVPPIMYSLEHAIRKYFGVEPMVVGPGVKTGINIKIDNPREVGADRIVNAVAAIEKYGGPLIIVDFGTATTFCAVNRRNEYLGGIICPGVRVSADALVARASKLPRVDLVKPENVIGKNTVAGMQSGLIYGYIGQVDYLVRRMKKEMKEDQVRVIATGGLASLIATESETINEVDKLLTLEGLRLIYEKNKV